jgi:predicted metal-dependent hydrolase
MIQSSIIYLEEVGTVVLQKSRRARHVNITVKPFRGVRVAVPMQVYFADAERIARSRTEWIKKHSSAMRDIEEKQPINLA